MARRAATRKTVEDFLAWAFDPDFHFQGREWADGEAIADIVEPPPARALDFSMVDGPLVRMRCIKCGQTLDAWLDDDRKLEDWRDAWHWHLGEGERGATVRWPREPMGDDDS